MKIKIDAEEFDYSDRNRWLSVLGRRLGEIIVSENRSNQSLDILIYENEIVTDPTDNLPLNIMSISLIDYWGLQYRNNLGTFECFPDLVTEADVISLIDQYVKGDATFKAKFNWESAERFGYGLSYSRKSQFDMGTTISFWILGVAVVGMVILYFL